MELTTAPARALSQLLSDGVWLKLKIVNQNGFAYIQGFDAGKNEWVSIFKLSEWSRINSDIEFPTLIDLMHCSHKDSPGFPNQQSESCAHELELILTEKIQRVECPECRSRFLFKLTTP